MRLPRPVPPRRQPAAGNSSQLPPNSSNCRSAIRGTHLSVLERLQTSVGLSAPPLRPIRIFNIQRLEQSISKEGALGYSQRQRLSLNCRSVHTDKILLAKPSTGNHLQRTSRITGPWSPAVGVRKQPECPTERGSVDALVRYCWVGVEWR